MSKNKTSSGIGISGLLLVSFVILKLCKVIDWSWWWVLSPFWLPILLTLAFVMLIVFNRSIRR
jgi:phosphoglycerol transferase MdoB-like AlkP superfamily enzyme